MSEGISGLYSFKEEKTVKEFDINPDSGFYARIVSEEDEPLLWAIAKYQIEPLYGNQSRNIRDWISGQRHKYAFLAFDSSEENKLDGTPVVGFLCMKIDPNKDYLKISTLVVFKNFEHKGKGAFFLRTVEDFVRFYDKKYIIVTVSEEKFEAKKFFEANGFKVIGKELGKYKEGVVEYILRKDIEF